MPRTALTPIAVPLPYAQVGQLFNTTAADVANGNSFKSTGKELLIVENTDASPHNVSVTSTASAANQRTGNITTFAVPASNKATFQIFPQDGWIQADGYIYINGDHAGLKFAVLRLP